MPPRAEPRPRATALLTIQGPGGAWGIPSIAVTSVERLTASSAQTPIALLALLGVASIETSDAQAHPRVIVLQVEGEQTSLLVHGELRLAQASAHDLLPLPVALQATTPLVSHLAVIDGKPALFVVSPERLLAAARRAAKASSHDAGQVPHDSASR